MRTRLLPIALLALALLLGAGPLRAQTPEQVEAFVYGVNAAVPDAVIGTFAPPSVETLYLLADRTSILSPRRTLVYFWPITNEYRAAWGTMNEQVEGRLELLQGGRLIDELSLTPYTIQFSSGEGGAKPALYLGEEASVADERFQQERLAYQQEVLAYQEARQAWLALARELQGSDTPLPDQPEPPPPLDRLSTGLNRGYPITLAPGRYQIRTRGADGAVVPGSERQLVLFEPRRTAVGYEVIPEARWTIPEPLDDLSDLILGRPGSVLYLRPQVIREVPSLPYDRLENPQFPGDAAGSEWRWISGESVEGGTLELLQDGRLVDRLTMQDFYVRQTVGAELGYEILPYEAGAAGAPRRPDFTAYRVALAADQPAVELRLVGPEGEPVVGGERQVRVAQPPPLRRLLLVALIPLLVGGAVLVGRQQRVRGGA